MAAIQALLAPALQFRASLDAAASRLLTRRTVTVRPRTTAHPSRGGSPFARHTWVDQQPHRETTGNQRADGAKASRSSL